MKKSLLSLLLLLCLTSCAGQCKYEVVELGFGNSTNVNMKLYTMEDNIVSQNFAQKGSYFQETYQSKDYLLNGEYHEKKVGVYLPYGYDATKSYDIVYLMHGHTGTIDDMIRWSKIKDVLDVLIEEKKIPPLIAVSPTYTPNNETGKVYSIEQCFEYIKLFNNEFENDLMPFIEGKYHTYANLTTTKESLEASRNHRIFGGFSLGSLTTWYEVYNHTNYISTFIPMALDFWTTSTWAGKDEYTAKSNANALIRELVRKEVDKDSIQVYSAIGRQDSLYTEVDNYITYLFKRSDYFTSYNLHYGVYNEGKHDLDAARIYFLSSILNVYGDYSANE